MWLWLASSDSHSAIRRDRPTSFKPSEDRSTSFKPRHSTAPTMKVAMILVSTELCIHLSPPTRWRVLVTNISPILTNHRRPEGSAWGSSPWNLNNWHHRLFPGFGARINFPSVESNAPKNSRKSSAHRKYVNFVSPCCFAPPPLENFCGRPCHQLRSRWRVLGVLLTLISSEHLPNCDLRCIA